MRKQVLSILVENTPALLSHVAGLFSRRGFNIDSISAGVTSNPNVTRITIVTSGDEQILEQIEKQVAKLCDVIHVQILDPDKSVTRELMMVKIQAHDTDRQSIISITEIFHGKVVDVTKDSMIIEVTGKQGKIDSFLDMLQDYKILELARTGLTGLTRGSEDVYHVGQEDENVRRKAASKDFLSKGL